jgi:hypothetical protein
MVSGSPQQVEVPGLQPINPRLNEALYIHCMDGGVTLVSNTKRQIYMIVLLDFNSKGFNKT